MVDEMSIEKEARVRAILWLGGMFVILLASSLNVELSVIIVVLFILGIATIMTIYAIYHVFYTFEEKRIRKEREKGRRY